MITPPQAMTAPPQAITIKRNTNRPMSNIWSIMDSRFMPQSYTTKYFPELLTANLLRAT